MPRRPACALLLVAAFVAVPPAAAQHGPRGTLIIVGGGEHDAQVMDRFVALAGGRGRARIAILPMASEDAAEAGRELLAEFDSVGARGSFVLLDAAAARDPAMVRALDSATGIWFGGGDQVRITGALRGTPALAAIRRRYREGAVLGGTSAGAAIMSATMLTGNQHPPADTLGYYGDEYPAIARDRIETVDGLGFLTNAIVDQHFLRRERHNRLLSAVLERPALLGVGIDESTALEVTPAGTWRVLGRSAAVVYDARRTVRTPVGAPVLGATGIVLHVLPSGSTFDPARGTARLPVRVPQGR